MQADMILSKADSYSKAKMEVQMAQMPIPLDVMFLRRFLRVRDDPTMLTGNNPPEDKGVRAYASSFYVDR
jgi:hypothetical protein